MPSLFLPTIRYIYFDFDNVLATRTESRSALVTRLLDLPDSKKLRDFYFVDFHRDPELEQRYLYLKTVEEEIAFYRDLFELFAAREGVKVSDNQLMTAARSFVHVPLQVPDVTLEALQRLRTRYMLGILSNGVPSRHQEVVASGLRPYFSGVIVSCDYHVEKPAREIYEIAIKAAGVPAAEIALVDDEPANISAAGAAGFGQAVLFTPAFWRQAL